MDGSQNLWNYEEKNYIGLRLIWHPPPSPPPPLPHPHQSISFSENKIKLTSRNGSCILPSLLSNCRSHISRNIYINQYYWILTKYIEEIINIILWYVISIIRLIIEYIFIMIQILLIIFINLIKFKKVWPKQTLNDVFLDKREYFLGTLPV